MNDLITFVYEQYQYIGELLLGHIQLTLLSVTIAVCIGIPLGIFISGRDRILKPVMGFANLAQALPSLALLGFLVPYMGIGSITAVSMVVLYSLLPILKNTCTGLRNISSETLEAAKGIGMTDMQILFKVRLPLALPVIMAGIRISSVNAVGLMTIAAYIGAGGLGTLVISGIQTDNSNMILAGAIPACCLALLMDFVMSKIETAVTPVSLQPASKKMSTKTIEQIKSQRKKTLAVAACIILISGGFLLGRELVNRPDIRIGSKDATESVIIGNMLADLIEAKTDIKVERRLALGGTMIAFEALRSGEIDLYPEYTGTGYSTILKNKLHPGFTPEEMYDMVEKQMRRDHNIELLGSLGFNNTYVLAVTKETAEKYHLKTVTDLTRVSHNLRFGCSPEFAAREDGLLGIEKVYGMKFASINNFSGTLMYTAIVSDNVDVITAFSTDGLLQKYDLVLLEDDKHFFPPYYMCPFLNMDTAEEYPELAAALNELGDAIDDYTMQGLNYEVVEKGRDRAEVARSFLIERGLVTSEDFKD